MGGIAGAEAVAVAIARERRRAVRGGLVTQEPILWVVAVIAIGFALLMVAAPQQFSARTYGALRPNLEWLGLAFAASAASLLLATLGVLRASAAAIALVLASLPFAAIAVQFAQSGSLSGMVLYAAVCATLVLIAWRATAGSAGGACALHILVGVTQLVTGAAMVALPRLFDGSVLARLDEWLPVVGAFEAAAGAALLLTASREQDRARALAATAAAIAFAPILLLCVDIRSWTGVLAYGALSFELAVSAWPSRRLASILAGLLVAAVIALDDLRAMVAPDLADLTLWSRMAPAASVLVLTLVVAFALETLDRGLLARRALYTVAALGGAIVVVTTMGAAPVTVRELMGHDVLATPEGPMASTGFALLLLGAGGLVAAHRQRIWSMHLSAAIGTVVMAMSVVNLFAYIVDAPFLVASYGPLALRLHATLPLAALGGALLATATRAIARGPIAGRVFGGLGLIVFGILVLGLYGAAAVNGLLALMELPAERTLVLSAAAISEAILLVFLFTVVALGILFTRTVTRPLDALADVMGRFASGDREARAIAQGEDEVARAMRAFNTTADRLVRSEGEVRQLNAELERRVFERTAELAATTKELEAFAYSVSHDLRAPLRAIDGFVSIVAEDDAGRLSAASERYLGKISAAAAEMSAIIDDLLRLSLVSRSEMRRERVDVTALARELLERDADHGTVCVVAEGMTATADPGLLRTALENLIANAVKFTRRAEGPRIEVGQDRVTGELFVRDNGVGFDMAYATRLFEPFQRLHAKDDFEGTGIGLATVRRVATRHGGSARADAQPGAGATFYLSLGGAS